MENINQKLSFKISLIIFRLELSQISPTVCLIGPFRVNSQEVVRSPSPIFLKFYSTCHYPIPWTSAKFELNLSRNGMIIKLFSWGCLAGEAQIVHIWPCLKPYYCQTTLVNNPNVSGMLVTSPNIEKITLSKLWLSKVKGHGHPKLTESSSRYKFWKIFKPRHGFLHKANAWSCSFHCDTLVDSAVTVCPIHVNCEKEWQHTPGPQPTDIFGGAKWCSLLLYLTNTYLCENFWGGTCPISPLWLRAWHTPLSESNANGERSWFNSPDTDKNFWSGIQWLDGQ